MIAEHVEQELPHDRERVITVRELYHLHIPVVDRLAEIRERIFAPSLSFDFAGELEEQRRLTDQVESDVRKRDILFENRPMPAPLRKTMTMYETIIAKAEEILGECRGETQKPFSPRGIL